MRHTITIRNCSKVLSTIFTLIYVLHFFASVWIYLGVAYPDGWYASGHIVPAKQSHINEHIVAWMD
jgi:hypothetical protein